MKWNTRIASSYRWAILSFVLQLLFLTVFLLAQSQFALWCQITGIAAAGFLGGIIVIVCRRPTRPTRADLLLIHLWFIPLWIAAQIVARHYWEWRGLMQLCDQSPTAGTGR